MYLKTMTEEELDLAVIFYGSTIVFILTTILINLFSAQLNTQVLAFKIVYNTKIISQTFEKIGVAGRVVLGSNLRQLFVETRIN